MSDHSTEQAARLRAGARAMRAAVGPGAWAIPAMAEGLDNDADRLDRGEPVEGLQESLDLADTFAEEVPDA